MCVLLITRLLRGVGRWTRKPVNHTSWVAVVTQTDSPKSDRNCCLIELFCGVVCVVTLPFWHFCWCRGFCHSTGSDLLLFVFIYLFKGKKDQMTAMEKQMLFVNCWYEYGIRITHFIIPHIIDMTNKEIWLV